MILSRQLELISTTLQEGHQPVSIAWHWQVCTKNAQNAGRSAYNFTCIYCFTSDYEITLSTTYMPVNENGSRAGSRDLVISNSGYSFGDVRITVTPQTYSEYEAMTGKDITEPFPRPPEAAASSKL